MTRRWMVLGFVAFCCLACEEGAAILVDLVPQGETWDANGAVDAAEPPEIMEETGPDLAVDLPELDADLAETGGGCAPGEGCFLDPCEQNEDCLSGWCVEHMGEEVCTLQCTEECPPGWSCQQVAGTAPDLVFVCVSDVANLCRPCSSGDNCKSVGGAEDVCVDYGPDGNFCGGTCASNEDCPWGFSCAEALTVDGISTKQCVADAGVCPCTKKAVKLALWTPCTITNEAGTCSGKRICTDSGLSACDASVPAPELCDGLDNDCNGDVDDVSCDDGNPCTQDLCEPDSGCAHEPLTGTECTDGNVCTLADHCDAGVCVGSLIDCDDNNPCTDDACNPTGGCVYTDNFLPCDDGDVCTVKDTCEAGECSGYAVPCDCAEDKDCGPLEDGDLCNGTLVCDTATLPYKCALDPASVVDCPPPANPCLAALCDPVTGKCGTAPVADGTLCTDANACTAGDQCLQGTCTGGPKVNCNDGNPCTTDLCDPATGCLHELNALPCNDGDACTTGDICQAGECLGTGTLNCDDGNPCTEDFCNPAEGCAHGNSSDACDDGNACTPVDQCLNGLCKGTGLIDCNDDNPCTVDSCNPAQGCLHAPASVVCDDGDACTTGDFCVAGACKPKGTLNCDDGNPCTDDSCDAAEGCVHANSNGECDDNNSCTTGDTCKDGKCVGVGSLECDDSNPCTKDICLPQGGCQHDPVSGTCSDGDACTVGDKCMDGECTPGPAVDCDDGNPCTDDSCDPESGCAHVNAANECSDGNACTVGDHCDDGACVTGGLLDCDDENVCTTDSCDPAKGCIHLLNSAPCTDDDLCTTGDHCHLGDCISSGTLTCSDGNPCTDDGCNPEAGCTFTANNVACDDGNACTTIDTCTNGACKGAAPPDCDDGNPCTTDACDVDLGCVHVNNTVPCDDGDVCTVNDLCAEGACGGGDALNCNDGNVCTDDSCAPDAGCQFVANDAACDDGDACTTIDACVEGECVGSTPPDCDDDDICTDDSCDSDLGCVHADNTAACDDGDACTTQDACADGICVGGPAPDCDDSDNCTADSCDSDVGCVHTPINCCGNGAVDPGEACDDGNQVGGDGCSADCKSVEYVHHNGQGVTWYNSVPTGTINEAQAKLSCEKSFGNCCYSGGDCAGPGYCQSCQSGKCWGWTSGCSGGAGRVWQYGSSYTTYGNWD